MPNQEHHFLRKQINWENLYFYQKTNTLYMLTYRFTQRFLKRGDRTIDQMVQAARSGKQNIVEGSANGETSMEMEIRLLNVARSSLKELREDFQDYLHARQLTQWESGHPRYNGMLAFCKAHNRVEDYERFFDCWSDEEMANVALSLCHITDKLMSSYQERLESQFVKEGGIKERMSAARNGYRNDQKQQIDMLRKENETLQARVWQLESILTEHGIKY